MEVPTWITVTLLLVVLAVALQIAGFVAPLWIWLKVNSFKVGLGLWFTIGCGEQNTCDSPPPNVTFDYTVAVWQDGGFTAVRVLESLGMAGGIMLLLFLFIYRLGYGSWTNMDELNLAAFVTCIITWLCILAGLIVYCAAYWPVVGTSPLITSESFPWSLVLCLLAAAVFIVICVLIRAKCRDRTNLRHALPVAGDSRMEQYPVTKHGLLHRYFVPLYRGTGRAIGYHSEGKNMHTMNTRLVDAEEDNQLAAIDNVAFYSSDNKAAGGSHNNYRYLPNGGNYHADHSSEAVIRRSLPTGIVTYTEANTSDAQRMYMGGGTATAVQSHNDLNRDGRRADMHMLHTSDDVAYSKAAAMGRSGMMQHQHGQEVGILTPHNHGGETAAYGHHAGTSMDVTSQQTRGVVAGNIVTHHGDKVHDALLGRGTPNIVVHDTSGNIISQERVVTTTTTYITEERRGGLKVSEVQSSDGRDAHSSASRSEGGSVNPYDDTYIYRPYSEKEIKTLNGV